MMECFSNRLQASEDSSKPCRLRNGAFFLLKFTEGDETRITKSARGFSRASLTRPYSLSNSSLAPDFTFKDCAPVQLYDAKTADCAYLCSRKPNNILSQKFTLESDMMIYIFYLLGILVLLHLRDRGGCILR